MTHSCSEDYIFKPAHHSNVLLTVARVAQPFLSQCVWDLQPAIVEGQNFQLG